MFEFLSLKITKILKLYVQNYFYLFNPLRETLHNFRKKKIKRDKCKIEISYLTYRGAPNHNCTVYISTMNTHIYI